MPGKKILIVEDEPDIRNLVRYHLAEDGFQVLEAEKGEEAMKILRQEIPDLIILDLMLPGLSGLELCRALGQQVRTSRVPILMLTAKAAEADRVVGLEMGADDYVTKPFSPRELVARVKAIMRRAERQARESEAEFYERGSLRIHFGTYEVSLGGKPVKLTLKEFEILRALVQNPNRVLSREQLLDRIWGRDVYVDGRTVDVHIRRLRKAMGTKTHTPDWIVTVRGVGYKFDEEALEK